LKLLLTFGKKLGDVCSMKMVQKFNAPCIWGNISLEVGRRQNIKNQVGSNWQSISVPKPRGRRKKGIKKGGLGASIEGSKLGGALVEVGDEWKTHERWELRVSQTTFKWGNMITCVAPPPAARKI